MSMILDAEADHSDSDLVSVKNPEDSLTIINGRVVETSPLDGSVPISEDSDSESLDSSFLDIDDKEVGFTGPVGPDEQQMSKETEEAGIETTKPRSEGDLCSSIPGLYRILDLISERGTSGLVDKIIIAQDSLKSFLNEISPGSYTSLTKVDFKALDKFQVKPLGIYGSKEEIVRFLLSTTIIDDTTAKKLVSSPERNAEKPLLRSGLYICRILESSTLQRVYVIYWPEDSAWDDDASSPVRRNRVTFIRYLTKICDQVTALVSEDHAKSLVWSDSVDDDQLSESGSEDDTNRLFTYEVAKTKEQEEGISVRPGFECTSDQLSVGELHPDCKADLEVFMPHLLYGETRQGAMTMQYIPGKRSVEHLNSRRITALLLESSLLKERLRISETMVSPRSLDHLVRLGLKKRFPDECNIWMKDVDAVRTARLKHQEAELKKVENELKKDRTRTESIIRSTVVKAVFSSYPTFDHRQFFSSAVTPEEESRMIESYTNLVKSHPRIANMLNEELRAQDCKSIVDGKFRKSKEKIILTLYLSEKLLGKTKHHLAMLVSSILEDTRKHQQEKLASILHEIARPRDRPPKPTQAEMQNADKLLKEGSNEASRIDDPDFISALEDHLSTIPALHGEISAAREQAQRYLGDRVDKICRVLGSPTSVRRIQLEDIEARLKREAERLFEQDCRNAGRSLIQKVNSLIQNCDSMHTLSLKSVMACKNSGPYRDKHPQNFDISGQRETWTKASLSCTIHLMHLTTQDRHELEIDPTKVPNPRFQESYSFQLQFGYTISHAQLLQGDRILLVLVDPSDNILLHLDHLNNIESSIGRGNGKLLHREKIGEQFLLAFDESQTMLVVISCEKLQLHVFVYDDRQGFTASGSAITLSSWYAEGTTIKKACFASGTDEILLVDSRAIARLFSLASFQPRPATLDLHHVPADVLSSPDGSCFLAVTSDGDSTRITTYHWSTFGSTDGILLPVTDWAGNNKLVVSSFVHRSTVYLLKLDLSTRTCCAVALDVTRKITEFMFRERGSQAAFLKDKGTQLTLTAHNCIMDCHADVWSRFPVLPAIQRSIISPNDRYKHSILFVTDRDHERYRAHFSDMIDKFMKTSKKPARDRLSKLHVSAVTFGDFMDDFFHNKEWSNISLFRIGEWVVDILCLIPIHIALARDNRFVPLKDGVYSSEVEKSLLGAEINQIVNSISFGWYESIFQSYMADKPVRVVSSMGEQSVGKSFALNHLVDTSFAGSAMRTTEGVWMSVAPTKEALIVALDFEGVHSLERSAQEDMLLVLFNAAISNMVLFRNNFALNRDITELFQSFQSSSTILDPVANPSLFQSTLVIIIKDVVDSDAAEIAREFRLKFQQIVKEEQGDNFITRLHHGKLDIIPWPVIESRNFYKLFQTLKRLLDKQDVTHKAAGEFLHLMKTLMAKLKANDWGALSHTMAAHRAELLLATLPNALAFGTEDVEPEIELLKNIDTDMPIDSPDTNARFFVPDIEHSRTMSREEILCALFAEWDGFGSRQFIPDTQWADELSQYLENLVEIRISHVRAWVKSNLVRFPAGHESVTELHRMLESAVIDLKNSIQLCRVQCASCQLLCIQNRFHNGVHDCKTNHTCTRSCEYCTEVVEFENTKQRKCIMTAGHSGRHSCSFDVHLCGVRCKLWGTNGCLEGCAKASGHENDDHQCAATKHTCGEPCDLNAKVPTGWLRCQGRCGISVDIEHDSHQCDTKYCPIRCQLCSGQCSSSNHLHALEKGAIHLCGESHNCPRACAAPGICQIDTTPESVEETFNGMYECFQYTRYSQVAKRLKCVKIVPPGELRHKGSHQHSEDSNTTHYCEIKCKSCQYYCTLPLGHSKKEHETSHGSMSNLSWSVDGPDDDGIEVAGRVFSTNDGGAPMMCNAVCKALGPRHVHIDYCRAKSGECRGASQFQHVKRRLQPQPEKPKDFLAHGLFWRRIGFKDPYTHDERDSFAKCDAMCPGTEHAASPGKPAKPSYCDLPLFHDPLGVLDPRSKQGHISKDGHLFLCRTPTIVQRTAFHIIFLIDRSKSMKKADRTPEPDSPVYSKICDHGMNNRLGAVYASLYNFWMARQNAYYLQRDANTIIFHAEDTQYVCENDTTSSPDELLDLLLPNTAKGGNGFDLALKTAEEAIKKCSNKRLQPVIIFLSDGIASAADGTVRRIFKKRTPLSLYAILFGPKKTSERMEQMVKIAGDTQFAMGNNSESSFHEALDSVQLSQTFLKIADSLRKTRGGLI